MKIENIKAKIDNLNIKQRKELIDYIKNSYSIFNEYSAIGKCPYCNSEHIVKNGTRNGINRYKCKDCNKTFTYKTNTVLTGIQKLNKWNLFVEDFISLNITCIKDISKKLNISVQTALDWRHKLLSALVNKENAFRNDIIEFDEAWFLISRKGRRNMNIEDKRRYRNWRKSQVGDTKYTVKLFTTFGRNSNRLDLFISHMGRTSVKNMENYFLPAKFQNITAYTDKHRSYSSFFKKHDINYQSFLSKNHVSFNNKLVHNQTVNAYIRDFRDFVNTHLKGVSTKYIGFYAKWFEFIVNTKKMIQKKISEVNPVRFNLTDSICYNVVSDYNGLEYYRQSEISFVSFLRANKRTNFGECKNHYYGI